MINYITSPFRWFFKLESASGLVLLIGAVFALIGGFVNWFPLITGLSLFPLLLKSQFIIIFLGVNITFFPIHFLGLAGIPRRYSDYPDFYAGWNFIARVGRIISIVSVILFIFILIIKDLLLQFVPE